MNLIGYETIIFQVYTVSRPRAKLFNYINIKDFSYHKKGQHSPTPAVWLFVLSRPDERKVPDSFSALEMSIWGTEEEGSFNYRPCNVQSTVQGCKVCLLCPHFATYTPTACVLFQRVLGKGFTLPRHEVGIFRARNEKSYPVADQGE